MIENLDTLRTTVENAGEAWADGEHIDIITPAVVLELIESAEAAELALDHYAQRDRELKTLLSMISDRLDEFCYDELSSLIEDSPLDQWGETYKSRLEQAEQAVERAKAVDAAQRRDKGILFRRATEAEQAVQRTREALSDVQARGEKIRAKSNNGSIYQQERAARGEGYLEATRLAFRALDGDSNE